MGKGLVCLVYLMMMSGCAPTTDDPRQGGLFGYNPGAYEKRLADRQAALAALEAQKAQQDQQRQTLEQTAAARQAEKEALNRQLAELDKDILTLEKNIRKIEIKSDSHRQQRANLAIQMNQLIAELDRVKAGGAQADEAAKKKEVERLKKELDRLLEEAEALSKL